MNARAPITQPSLFDPAPAAVRAIHERAEDRHAAFFAELREIVVRMFAGRGEITTDEVHTAMKLHGLEIPEDASPNLMGSFFSAWDRAVATGNVVRSKRPGANGNLLRTWTIR